MLKLRSTEDTICALTTPQGIGGISVVRISGPEAVSISRKIMNLPTQMESHRAQFLTLFDLQKNPIDEVVVTYFAKGHSFTGDETLEISCHGSPAITEEIVNLLLRSGCRHADRGEFTFRAFMSGKIDLVQAESVLSLIESETKKAAEVSLRQLKGELSKKIVFLKEKLLYLIAHLEASIDFSLENLETISLVKASQEISELRKAFAELAGTYQEGKVLSDSFSVALVGEPNVGKSSLFNLFVQAEKAIVTEIAGTTRDAIEGFAVISGIKVKFVDTAGLRATEDRVEKIGIQKTREQIQSANLIFYVLDATNEKNQIEEEILLSYEKKTVFLINKTDLAQTKKNSSETSPAFHVSAKESGTLAQVIKFLEEKLKNNFNETSAVVLKSRQFETLSQAKECLSRAEILCQESSSQEFIAFELRDALDLTMELLGEKFDDKILQKVFQEFCIGK